MRWMSIQGQLGFLTDALYTLQEIEFVVYCEFAE